MGRAFNQLISKIKSNKGAIRSTPFLSSPVKQHRREIDTDDNCVRASVRLMDFYNPGATIVNSETGNGHHEIIVNNVKAPSPEYCVKETSEVANARRRCRSSGNLVRTFDCNNNITYKYNITSKQHLEKTNSLYEQNNYFNIKCGEPTFSSGIPSVIHNIYKPSLYNSKSKIRLTGYNTSSNPLFRYVWVNGQSYDFLIEDGDYDLEDINIAFKNTQTENKHYLIDQHKNNVKRHFFNIAYDSAHDAIQLQCFAMSAELYHSDRYKPWTSYLYKVDWNIPIYAIVPNIELLDNGFLAVLGFSNAGFYPPENINGELGTQPATNTDPSQNTYINKSNYYVMGEHKPLLRTRNQPLYYKPSNNKFAQNGGVSSSSLVTRLKYDTITEMQTTYTSALGKNVANALAYATFPAGYSKKYIKGADTCK